MGWDTAWGWGGDAQSEVPGGGGGGTDGAGFGVPEPARRPGRLVLRLSGIQMSLGARKEPRTEWGPAGPIQPGAGGERGELSGWSLGDEFLV